MTDARAQWIDFVSRDYRFSINFPAEPRTRDVTYTTAEGAVARARVYAAEQGTGIYTVTVVVLPGSATNTEAELAHAVALLREAGTVRNDGSMHVDGIPAHELSVALADGRQILATVLVHEGRLYIVEGSEAGDAAPPIQFQQSIAILDANGNPVAAPY
jgi:hypothetical protein